MTALGVIICVIALLQFLVLFKLDINIATENAKQVWVLRFLLKPLFYILSFVMVSILFAGGLVIIRFA